MSDQQFRVWWIPQVPMPAFHFAVASANEGRKFLAVLADYDAFQYEHNVKPDYCNAGGVEQLVDGEWEDVDDDE